jgi:hypothetical protein
VWGEKGKGKPRRKKLVHNTHKGQVSDFSFSLPITASRYMYVFFLRVSYKQRTKKTKTKKVIIKIDVYYPVLQYVLQDAATCATFRVVKIVKE